MNKKILFLGLLSTFFLIYLGFFASGAGCCINNATMGCQYVASQDNCMTGSVIYLDGQSCSDPCALGCCCNYGSTLGKGRLKYFCISPQTFVSNLNVNVGDDCSCGGNAFTVAGRVERATGGYIGGATVSIPSIQASNTTNLNGFYSFSSVPANSYLQVTAHKNSDGCLPNSAFINLNQDKTDVNIILSCSCNPGDCNITLNAYCNYTSRKWHVYDTSVSSQKTEYCIFCGDKDPADCGGPSQCVNNDMKCPPECTAAKDTDCACSSTSNGVCPPGCEGVDPDCTPYSHTCGDGTITYPYETCEDSPNPGQVSLCSANDCADSRELDACNCRGLSGCGNLILEPGEVCEIGMMCPSGTPCENCQCGPISCTETKMNPNISTSFDAPNKKIIASWALLSSCQASVLSYSVFKCDVSLGSCASKTEGFSYLTDTPVMLVNDLDILQNSEYCYFVRANYMGGLTGESGIRCQKTGSSFCMEPHSKEFCINNIRSYCDSNNNIQPISGGNCNPNKYCVGPDRDGLTQCIDVGLCDLCNGLYGMYSNLDLRVGDEKQYCYADDLGLREVVTGCYLDRTKTLLSSFNYCAKIASCYDYKSEEACTDTDDPCLKNKGCEWEWLNDVVTGLSGICRPVAEELQRCEFCDDSKYNWLSSGCSPRVCSLFGECYYQGKSPSNPTAPTCTKTSTASCLGYINQSSCTGGRPVSVDAGYNTNGTRISGTHTLTVPSNDTLGLGKCFWDTVNTRCRRNADNYPQSNTGLFGYDCAIGDTYCEADFSEPETVILPTTFGVYPANMKILFTTSDNYAAKNIKTYFCISQGSCYPNELASSGVYQKLMTVSGTHTLRYYSEDPSKNLEEVQVLNIIVDAVRPFIDLINPATTDEFPTNQLSVPVQGITSKDSKWVCAKNTRTSQTVCINNCALTSGQQPCFPDTTGIFDLTIPLTSTTNLTQVIFSAEDFAGNTYQNTLLGILLDIEPPSEPNITISGIIS
ncbi:MAG TPA: carboxypeptidase-like regulatory domain-containing protein [Candidatus Nanoarchaeia archaeon]|nr:carboxypeptidase-like regulatory domain-containing protein [Candidatus Nanoarchaeia archaeon]